MTKKIRADLHMHSVVSDGTDTPEEILAKISKEGLDLFSLTDHDDFKGCDIIRKIRRDTDPAFITGVEFSCRDDLGKYHILGYGFDTENEDIRSVIRLGHQYRVNKVKARLDYLMSKGISFSEKERSELLALDNPGKPHIAKLMVRHGYAQSITDAIRNHIDGVHFKSEYVRPEEAITGILKAGGIPVLAHPSYGSGDQIIIGEEMDERLQYLIAMGLQGVEAYYSGFTDKLRDEILGFAKKYDLYVTAGSDYHGANKLVVLGDTGLDTVEDGTEELHRFLNDIRDKAYGVF